MNDYRGKYYIKGGAEQAAIFSFLKDRLSIKFNDENNNGREVFWYYDEIIRENFRQANNLVIRYSGYPEQIIEAFSVEFANQLEVYTSKQYKRTAIKILARVSPLLRVLIVIFLLLLAVYLWLVPYLAVRLAEKVPVSYEENLGNGMYNSMKAGFDIDEKKTAYINEFFSELNIPTLYKIKITVVKDNVSNAFAMPGGNIIVYDKIIAGMDNYTELAALLSHEFTHVQNKHTTKSLFREMGNSMFLSVIFGNAGAAGNVIIRNADNLKSLSYGRSLEREADLDGLKILTKRKIDGNGFVGLFKMLEKENNSKVSEWMSRHPDLEKRIAYIRQSADFNTNGVQENETLKTLFERIKGG
ncbi:MAG: M48 family metallopeptidase [Bacteroidetes bacterium]|nr:M48 family metallopeptidase [Bacteroidota bacterium]